MGRTCSANLTSKSCTTRAVAPSARNRRAKRRRRNVIGDSSYFPGKTKKVGQVARALFAESSDSQRERRRERSDHRSLATSAGSILHDAHAMGAEALRTTCARKDATLRRLAQRGRNARSTQRIRGWTSHARADRRAILPVSDALESAADGTRTPHYPTGYDATTHFETTVRDVIDMYKRITGKDLDLSKDDAAAADTSG